MIRTATKAFTVLVTSALIISGCGGGGGGHTTSLPSAPNNTNQNSGGGSNTLSTTTFNYGQALISKLAYSGPAKGGGMTIPVLVRMQNAAGLVSYAQSASNPASSNYRHWLTPAQIGAQYGATASDYAAAASYLQSFGLRVGGWPQREILTVSGSTSQFAKAFNTTFGLYTFMGKQVVAANSTPHLPSNVPIVTAPLIHGTPMRSYFIHPNNSVFYGYSPQQMQTSFDSSGAYSAGFTGAGIKIGVIGTGPLINTDGNIDDLISLSQYWHASVGTVTQVNASPQPASTANGGTGTALVDITTNLAVAPPITGSPSCSPVQTLPGPTYILNYQMGCNPEDGETQLDSQTQASLAPGASVLFYQAFNQNEGCYNTTTGNFDSSATGATCPGGDIASQYEGIYVSDDSIQQAIADNMADAISMSFGGPENLNEYYGYIGTVANPGVGQIEIASLVAEGIAVFVSSGDDGAWECFDPSTGLPLGTPCASYPASDINAVAVGGVNIPLDESGNLTGSITAWADNTTEGGNGQFGNNVGSGGGVSAYFTAPAWQAAALGASMRLIPDWSLDADPDTGPSVFIDGFPEAVGGTSASAPASAAMWALVLQACKASSTCNKGGSTGYRLGNPAPIMYAIYAKSNPLSGAYSASGFTPQLGYSNVFYDVVYGSNQAVPAPGPLPTPQSTPIGYNSGPGYDQVTGVGAPFAGHLIQAVTGTVVP